MSERPTPMRSNKMKFAAFFCLFMSGFAFAGWEKLPSLPEENGGFAVATDDWGITIVGGTKWENDTKQWLRSISRFEFKTQRWEIIAKLDEPVAYGLCSTKKSDDGKSQTSVMLGGSNGKHAMKIMAIIDTVKTALMPAPALPDTVVVSVGGLIADQFIIVGGGDDAANLAGFTNHAFAFDLSKRTLTSLPDFPGRPFGIAASAVIGSELFIFGGANWNEGSKSVINTADVHSFSITTQQWRKLRPYPFAARGVTAVALDDHRIYLAGGFTEPERFLSEAFIYDVRTDTYTKATPLPYTATLSLVLQDGFVYCLGGEDRKKHRTDACWRIRANELLQ
jgi:Galactose oxidase, central domain